MSPRIGRQPLPRRLGHARFQPRNHILLECGELCRGFVS